MSNKDRSILKTFGENLKKARKEKGLTTREFADIADIAHSQVWKLESGLVDPSLTTLLAIAKTLDVSIDGLVSEG
ncbi:helix-turn-helix domain-containing protein [Filimonas effusa]|uniref:XRE family transcriptional regulator n=1 Tax=Filimonas effusa TaxID=2508721 RepID=A0A4Q1D763_9BACT|nr:helix-turn-helix transcriptional regulator [Filimonas effusa]RXK83773.1 XRE family transcriptional regulator [Filimonas effusa]